tara:strand:+ start:309 stop:623 length:315 start_codon:yes stop_codon:yes gene_type:complete
MKTLHNTRNCNYRRFLHKKLKHGDISGKFYKFVCRTHPYRLKTRNIQLIVTQILSKNMTEDKAIRLLQQDDRELKHQQEMYKSNVECRKKISKTTTPYTKPLYR